MSKISLRAKLLKERKAQFTSTLQKASSAITHQLLKQNFFQKAKTVGLYKANSYEIQTDHLFFHATKQKKHCFYPKVSTTEMAFAKVNQLFDLHKGFKKILEPVTPVDHCIDLDLLVVPCVGIDFLGYRLGQGGGFYDRFLKDFKGFSVALAFDFQLQGNVYCDVHDQAVDVLVTPTRVYRF